jgi:coiled-coil and C2 domain-containing protein 2A
VSPFQLAAWLRRTGLDPNDPRNAPVLELLRAEDASGRSGRAFRLHSTEEELRLDGTRASKRLALLKMRWNKVGARTLPRECL